MNSIEIKNVQAVKDLKLEIPEGGGIVVLRGRNGSGKSTALRAVESAIRGTGGLEVSDGEVNGRVEGLGVKITVGKSTRRSGELEVESLEGKLSLSDLIEPGPKTGEAADTRRIKALCALAGAKADIKLFSKLLPKDQFTSVISQEASASDDIVYMAEKVKRDIEKEARRIEDIAVKYEGQALGAKNAAGDVDPTEPHDAEILQKRLEDAVALQAKVKEKSEAYEDAIAKTDGARKKIESARQDWKGGDGASRIEEATAAARVVAKLESEIASISDRIVDLEENRRKVNTLREKAIAEYNRLEDACIAAKSHEANMASWEQELEKALPPEPTKEEVEQADRGVMQARQAAERGVLVRKSLEDLRAAEKAMEQSKANREAALLLREAAGMTDEVLSELVGSLGTELRVEAGRLVLDTKRGATLYHDLSPGERASSAVDIGIKQIGSKGVMVLDQAIFEGLDPANRRILADHATAKGVVILTAEAADSDIQAEHMTVDPTS